MLKKQQAPDFIEHIKVHVFTIALFDSIESIFVAARN